jgi:hypothetical protein
VPPPVPLLELPPVPDPLPDKELHAPKSIPAAIAAATTAHCSFIEGLLPRELLSFKRANG